MNNLKQQILDLFQTWYEENYPVDWTTYKAELDKAYKLLTKIYNITKNYEEKETSNND